MDCGCLTLGALYYCLLHLDAVTIAAEVMVAKDIKLELI